MSKDWYLVVFTLVAALLVVGFSVTASAKMAEAFNVSGRITFAVDCVDKGGRASYNSAEELVCLQNNQIIDIYR